jgi:hypothetical protein
VAPQSCSMNWSQRKSFSHRHKNPLENGFAPTPRSYPTARPSQHASIVPGAIWVTPVYERDYLRNLASIHLLLHKRRTRQRNLTDLYGAFPLLATLVSRLDWNQPLCWSLPSKTRSEGNRSPSRLSTTPDQDEPAHISTICFLSSPPVFHVFSSFESAPSTVDCPALLFSLPAWFSLAGRLQLGYQELCNRIAVGSYMSEYEECTSAGQCYTCKVETGTTHRRKTFP